LLINDFGFFGENNIGVHGTLFSLLPSLIYGITVPWEVATPDPSLNLLKEEYTSRYFWFWQFLQMTQILVAL